MSGLDERVLLLAPTARDAATTQGIFEVAGIPHFLCKTIAEVCKEAALGAGAAIVTAEAILGDTEHCLAEFLKSQPPWSDFPLIVLIPTGEELPRMLREVGAIGHMSLMKRPVQVSTLVSMVQAAIRDRRRQYAVRDLLTERHQAAEALREERERFRVTLSSIGDAVIATDTEGRVTFINKVAEDLTCWKTEDALGRPLEEIFRIVNESTGDPVPNPALRALNDGRVVGLANHTILIARDGSRHPLDDSAAPIWNDRGEIIGAVLVFRDITERKNAERESRNAATANAKFRALFEQGTHFAGLLTLEGVVVEANRLCLDACGFSRDEVIGKPFWECGWWKPSPVLAAKVHEACDGAANGKAFLAESNYFISTGEERFVELTIAPVVDGDGRILFVAATGTDITERKLAEAELREADRKKDDFLALLAHELRNPLAPIRNGLQVMRLAGGDTNAINQARGMMDRQLSHMVRLIDDLLDVSRISRNKMELRRARVSLAEIVDSAVETARPAIDEAGHELTISLPSRPLFLDADLTRMAQVFSNLLTNSAKYTERGGHIWLSAEARNGMVAVTVKDNGIGVPEDSLENIFDMFSQVDRSIERSTGGLGIGLALVKGLVDMHGGTVAAESAGSGLGSMFTVNLPLLMRSTEPASVPFPPDALASSGRRILVVDDNRDGADSLAMMLRLMRNQVETAYDGLAAIEAADKFRPDLILMDVGMPKLNGLEAAKRIRERDWGREPIIIALTGWGQEDDRSRSKEAGCDGHLVKPVEANELGRYLSDIKRTH